MCMTWSSLVSAKGDPQMSCFGLKELTRLSCIVICLFTEINNQEFSIQAMRHASSARPTTFPAPTRPQTTTSTLMQTPSPRSLTPSTPWPRVPGGSINWCVELSVQLPHLLPAFICMLSNRPVKRLNVIGWHNEGFAFVKFVNSAKGMLHFCPVSTV